MTRLSRHDNVVDLKAVYEDENYVHLVMELCAGGELFQQLEKQGCFSAEARVLFNDLKSRFPDLVAQVEADFNSRFTPDESSCVFWL